MQHKKWNTKCVTVEINQRWVQRFGGAHLQNLQAVVFSVFRPQAKSSITGGPESTQQPLVDKSTTVRLAQRDSLCIGSKSFVRRWTHMVLWSGSTFVWVTYCGSHSQTAVLNCWIKNIVVAWIQRKATVQSSCPFFHLWQGRIHSALDLLWDKCASSSFSCLHPTWIPLWSKVKCSPTRLVKVSSLYFLWHNALQDRWHYNPQMAGNFSVWCKARGTSLN